MRQEKKIEVNSSALVKGIEEYKKSKERLITLTSNNVKVNRKITKTRKQKFEEKQLYGYFKCQIAGEKNSHGYEKGTSREKLNLF